MGITVTVVAVWLAFHPARGTGINWIVLGCSVLFGWVSALYAASVVVPATVTIAPDALTIRTFWRTRRMAWSSVGDFRIWQNRRAKLVVFERVGHRSAWGSVNRTIAGTNASLPNALDADLEALLTELQSAKNRWGLGPRPQPPEALSSLSP